MVKGTKMYIKLLQISIWGTHTNCLNERLKNKSTYSYKRVYFVHRISALSSRPVALSSFIYLTYKYNSTKSLQSDFYMQVLQYTCSNHFLHKYCTSGTYQKAKISRDAQNIGCCNIRQISFVCVFLSEGKKKAPRSIVTLLQMIK